MDTCIKAQKLGVRAMLLIGMNNLARANEVRYGGLNWQQLASLLQAMLQTK